jgi:hypothetical protein
MHGLQPQLQGKSKEQSDLISPGGARLGFACFQNTRCSDDDRRYDETLPGPWEWDVKRLATSLVVAGRDNDFDDAQIRPVAMTSVTAYREAMAEFAEAKTMDVWYAGPFEG